jgi:excisionase family DNA binding protein
MKQRSTQFAARKNPDSPRVHGLRLSVNSQPFVSGTRQEGSCEKQESPSSPPRAVTAFELPLTERASQATGESAPEPGHMLTIHEVAALLHVPVSWVYGRMRRRSSERLPAYRLGKYWRFREQEVLVWVESQRGGSHVA